MHEVVSACLTHSRQELPHHYLTVEINMDEILKLHEVFNRMFGEKERLPSSVYNMADISMAVAMPTGLITPIVKDGCDGDCQFTTNYGNQEYIAMSRTVIAMEERILQQKRQAKVQWVIVNRCCNRRDGNQEYVAMSGTDVAMEEMILQWKRQHYNGLSLVSKLYWIWHVAA
ncbi:hypothetical protein EDC04DRAFT_2597918 [Pisolithus marmoratus]|nr:hypothetical protein EDC04DRAFT_2597918 [Pisolithus marmoratus]